MSKRKLPEVLHISICNDTCILEYCEPGYYLGEIPVEYTHFHVEAIEVKISKSMEPGTTGALEACNKDLQGRLDRWFEANDDNVPRLFNLHGSAWYFVHMEVFAL